MTTMKQKLTDNHQHNIISLFSETVDSIDSLVNTETHMTTVQRQNCCLGASLLPILVIAYFFMSESYTASDRAIFGDDSSTKNASGELASHERYHRVQMDFSLAQKRS